MKPYNISDDVSPVCRGEDQNKSTADVDDASQLHPVETDFIPDHVIGCSNKWVEQIQRLKLNA